MTFKRHIPTDATLPNLRVAFNRIWDALEKQGGGTSTPTSTVTLSPVATVTTPSGSGSPAVTSHNTLTGIQGGVTGEYFHLTALEYAGTGTGVFVRQDSAALTGIPTAPQPAVLDDSGQIATTSHLRSQPNFMTRVEVNDTNYTVVGSHGVTVAFTALTATRTVFLPPATVAGQLLQVVDESGQCSSSRSIFAVPDGSDTLEAYTIGGRVNFPYANATLQSNGAGKWIVVATNSVLLSAGVVVAPSYTDNLDGSLTLGTGLYSLFADSLGIGRAKGYPIAGGTFVLTDAVNNYVVADYNSGVPVVQVITNVTLINETTVIPIFTIYREGATLHATNWDTLGDALSNKIHKSIVKTQRFRMETGLALGESAGRIITIGSGTIYVGAVPVAMPAVDSSGTNLRQAHRVAGVWTFVAATQYNNTQYDDGTNLQTLNPNKYAVNFVYRSVGVDNDFYTILGSGNYSLGDAQQAQPPANLPPLITSHTVLVGRIIVLKSAATATQIDPAFSAIFTPAGVTDHESLANLQGGAVGEHYHLTSLDAASVASSRFGVQPMVVLVGETMVVGAAQQHHIYDYFNVEGTENVYGVSYVVGLPF